MADDKNRGLYQKYIISKTDGTPVDPDAEFFVLNTTSNDPAWRHASCMGLMAVADAIAKEMPALALDLRHKVLDIYGVAVMKADQPRNPTAVENMETLRRKLHEAFCPKNKGPDSVPPGVDDHHLDPEE